MSLVGGMFDTIQRSNTLLNEWATILIQLVSCGVVSWRLHMFEYPQCHVFKKIGKF